MGIIEHFVDLLGLFRNDLEIFRYPVLDLVERYGFGYQEDALFVLGKLEKFAGAQDETLLEALSFYARYVMQVADDRLLLQGVPKVGGVQWDRRFELEYLYALTLSTVLNRSRYELFQDYRRTLEEHCSRQCAFLEVGAGNCLDAGFASSFGTVNVYEKNELTRAWPTILGLEKSIDLHIEEYRFDEPEAYDFVTMIEFLEHLENPGQCLENTARVLKEGGLAYLTFAIRMPQIDHLFNFTSIQECRDLVNQAGFDLIREQCLVDTYLPFEESERWELAEDSRQAVIYCCLVRKPWRKELRPQLESFTGALE
jgi:SAM-dependent methyltransferase